MKRVHVGLLVFVSLIYLSGGVFAAPYDCSDENDRMFVLSAKSNAHVENWSEGNYERDVCFSDYFTGGNPIVDGHGCSGSNKVAGISGATNAHIEGPDETTPGYGDICFADLDCFLQDSGKHCNETPGDSSYSLIVSIDGITNTHAAFTHLYPYSICCKSQTEGVNPLCNYDGTCGVGETPQNCPDCVPDCGNGVVEGIEECDCGSGGCDLGELGGFDCTNYTGNSIYVGGSLGCYPKDHDNQCEFKIDSCENANCSNGIDDDGDGYCDTLSSVCTDGSTPGDFSCSDQGDDNEADPDADCQDRDDNDNDGYCDWNGCDEMEMDPGCENSQDNDESVCGDGHIDEYYGEECDYGASWTYDLGEGPDSCGAVDPGYYEGEVNCYPPGHENECTNNVTSCVGYPGFCHAEAPFLYKLNEGDEAFRQPWSCQDYNFVYPGGESENVTKRKKLCELDCLGVSASKENNGVNGGITAGWCEIDSTDMCKYYYNITTSLGEISCEVDYEELSVCDGSSPFRKVKVTSKEKGDSGGSSECDGSYDTQIRCPKVIKLPFIGAFGIGMAALLIVIIYAYLNRRK